MNILAIETTGLKASVALRRENGEILEETCDETLNHLKYLMVMLQNLLKKSELSINDIDIVAVSEGPGSFTGIRIGMASAKALAQALKKDMICVPTLGSFAYHEPDFQGLICPIFDARRNQVYGGAYIWMDGRCCCAVEDGAYELGEFLLMLEQASAVNHCREIRLYGDGVAAYQELLATWEEDLMRITPEGELVISFASQELRCQKASSVAALAAEKQRAGQLQSLFDVKPVYLRKAEAERKLEASRG